MAVRVHSRYRRTHHLTTPHLRRTPHERPGQPAAAVQPGQQGTQGNQPPQYNQGYQQQSSGGSGLAIAALILGIIALLFSWTVIGGILFGLAAIVLGFIASSKAKKGTASGRGMAIVGIVTGVIGVLIGVAVIALVGSFFNSDEVQNLSDCLTEAGTDTAAQQQCRDDLERQLQDKVGGN